MGWKLKMSKIKKLVNEYFYAWGDNNPDTKIFRYGKYIPLRLLHGYDDYVYYRPRRQMAGTILIMGGITLVGSGVYKGVSYLKEKTNKNDNSNKFYKNIIEIF